MDPFRHLYSTYRFVDTNAVLRLNAYARLDGLMEPYVEALERELGYAAERYSLVLWPPSISWWDTKPHAGGVDSPAARPVRSLFGLKGTPRSRSRQPRLDRPESCRPCGAGVNG